LSPAFGLRLPALSIIALLACIAPNANAQRPSFASTLQWDAGLINIPAAYVAPLSGDLALNFSRVSLDSTRSASLTGGKAAAYNFSASVALWSRVEAGVSVFSGDLKSGLFAKVLLWDQTDGIWRSGFMHWAPSVAIGIRNLGSEKDLDRTGTTEPGSALNTSPTLYGVLTRTFVLKAGEEAGARPKAQFSLTAGFGNGLFKDDAGLKKDYAKSATGGAFGGGQLQFLIGDYSTISFLAEHDAWDVNAGIQFDLRGIRASAYINELGAGSGGTSKLGYQKVAFSLGWQTNFQALVRGNRMEQRAAEYEQQASALRSQIAAGEARVKALDDQLKALQASTTAERGTERAALEARLREEQAALRRLQELLKANEATKKP